MSVLPLLILDHFPTVGEVINIKYLLGDGPAVGIVEEVYDKELESNIGTWKGKGLVYEKYTIQCVKMNNEAHQIEIKGTIK